MDSELQSVPVGHGAFLLEKWTVIRYFVKRRKVQVQLLPFYVFGRKNEAEGSKRLAGV